MRPGFRQHMSMQFLLTSFGRSITSGFALTKANLLTQPVNSYVGTRLMAKADSRFGLPAFATDLLNDARLQNRRLLEVVNLLNLVQILLRGFLPCGFTRDETVVSPDAF